MRTKYKRIPFNIELAKKITNKEVKGNIITRNGLKVRIICFDRKERKDIFDPPKKITHWVDNGKINAQNFYNKYLSDINVQKDADRCSFLMGYYVHLLTDIEWSKFSKEKNA